MEILQPIIAAVIGWAVPRILDGVFPKAESEGVELEKGFPWAKWCTFHAIGGGVGGFLSGVLGMMGLAGLGGLGNWTVFGIAIGTSQWLVLRKYLDVGPFWVVFCAVGWSLWSIFQATKAPGPIGWSAVGLTVGVLQWFILSKVRGRAFLWVPTNLFGWLIAGTLGWTFGMGLMGAGVSFPIAWVLGWALVGLAGSVVLGWALQRMPAKASETRV
jgi:hypothetical protein